MANEEQQQSTTTQPEVVKRSPGRPRKEESFIPEPEPTARIRAIITGVGGKDLTVPASQVEKTLEKINRIGFCVDNGRGTRTYYLMSRIEKLDVSGIASKTPIPAP